MTFALCQARSAINWHRRRQLQVRKVEKRKNRQGKLRKTEREGEEKNKYGAALSLSWQSSVVCRYEDGGKGGKRNVLCTHKTSSKSVEIEMAKIFLTLARMLECRKKGGRIMWNFFFLLLLRRVKHEGCVICDYSFFGEDETFLTHISAAAFLGSWTRVP